MKQQLKILIVEDSKEDTELLVQALGRAGHQLTYERVETEDETRAALASQNWDLVISDYVLPSFSGLNALKMVQETELDIPFIIVSGKIGEEVAVDALHAGAHDYLLKDKLGRLGSAVARALNDGTIRRKNRKAEQCLKESEERYRRLVETSPQMMAILCEERIAYINPAGVELFRAKTPVDLIGRPFAEFISCNCRERFRQRLGDIGQELAVPGFRQRITTLNGESLVVEIVGRPIPYHGARGVQLICRELFEDNSGFLRYKSTETSFPELGSIFTVILGYAGLARSKVSPTDPVMHDLKQVIAGAERGVRLARAQNEISARAEFLRKTGAAPITRAPEVTDAASARPANKAILIVEDEQVLRELTELILVKHGFTVYSAKNSEEALEITETHGNEIGVLFTDVVIKKLTGPELAKKVQSEHPEICVLYTSGYPESVIAEYGVGSNFDFLPKPYSLQNLIQRITELLEVPKQTQ